jgi:dihydroorotate dehydrogenase
MNLFSLGQKALFRLDAESAHTATIQMLSRMPKLAARSMGAKVSSAPRKVCGLSFPNPVGVAAGLDKNGECIDGLFAMGFGFVEVGTVTPRPQSGNPRPRVFRLVEDEAIINRLGFNNKGVDALVRNVERSHRRGPLGINIGKNADTPMERAVEDYLYCLERVYALADYVTINISSPNTRNLRDLQAPEALEAFVGALMERAEQLGGQHGYRPMAVKVAPDNDAEQLRAMARILKAAGVPMVIATNTTISRPRLMDQAQAAEQGGLSGKPLCTLAAQQLARLRDELGSEVALVGVGGLHDRASAQARLAAGADLLQVYTGFVYRGPALIREMVAAAS